MSLSLDEIRHIASLARLGIDDAEAEAIAAELSAILDHMEMLARATTSESSAATDRDRALPLREDTGPPIPLARTPQAFAPSFQDGFFLVPRLATHEDIEPGA